MDLNQARASYSDSLSPSGEKVCLSGRCHLVASYPSLANEISWSHLWTQLQFLSPIWFPSNSYKNARQQSSTYETGTFINIHIHMHIPNQHKCLTISGSLWYAHAHSPSLYRLIKQQSKYCPVDAWTLSRMDAMRGEND